MKEENNVPDFLKDYHQGSNYQGKAKIENLAKQYETARQDFMRDIYPKKAAFQNDWNKLTRQNKQLDPNQATSHIRAEYGDKARKLAVENGYVEKKATAKIASPTQQQTQQERAKFMEQLKGQKAQQQQQVKVQQPQSPQQQTKNTAQPKQQSKQQQPVQANAEREKFLAKMQSMKQAGSQMTHRPKP